MVTRGYLSPLRHGPSDDSEAINPKVVFQPQCTFILGHEL